VKELKERLLRVEVAGPHHHRSSSDCLAVLSFECMCSRE